MKIAIIGAGVAGLSAGFYLTKNGLDVTIYEATSEVGGRVTSFVDSKTQDVIDNGQHLLIGAYFTFLDILSECGQLSKLNRMESVNIPYFYADGKMDLLSSNIRNSPIGFLFALFSLKTISKKSKLKTFAFFLRLLSNTITIKNKTVYEVLNSTKQNNEIIALLWQPLTLATLNTDIDKASMELLTNVLKKGFLASGSSSNLIFGNVPLLNLLTPQKEFIIQNGGNFVFNKKIDAIQKLGDKYIVDNQEFDKIILASSFVSTEKIIATMAEDNLTLPKVEFSPIVSIYLWFDKDYFNFDFSAFIGTSIQWVFNKRRIIKDNKHDGLISITISAANLIIEKSNNEIIELCYNDLKTSLNLPNLPKPQHYRVFKEKNATILASHENETQRPKQLTLNKNIYLAGCYTDTKYPSTIEGAALSGKFIADEIISNLKKQN